MAPDEKVSSPFSKDDVVIYKKRQKTIGLRWLNTVFPRPAVFIEGRYGINMVSMSMAFEMRYDFTLITF